ncbi:MAG: hypothetical protein Q4E69_02360 [Bacilli bacterium]|nr:hypothetical protein [Bacilli bacterium]
MSVKYLDEYIESPDGITCKVLDVDNIDFSSGVVGRKSKDTLVLRANGNEKINTINSQGLIETTFTTSEGNAIFYNNENDIYVPRDEKGTPWNFDDIENYGYELLTVPFKHNDNLAVRVKSTKMAYLLPEVIDRPSCIKDAFGKGNNQYLYEDATLKKDPITGKVTGIEKKAFDETWEITKDYIDNYNI